MTRPHEKIVKAAEPERLLHDFFVQRALENPDSKAVICEDRTLSYSDLEQASRQVALTLTERGIQPGTHIGILLDKGWRQCAATLGVLRAGCVFVPLDRDWPNARIHEVLIQADCSLVLLESSQAEILPANCDEMDVISALTPSERIEFSLPTDIRRIPQDVAYIIFTSGSTGTPKGVIITHAAASNTIDSVNDLFDVGPLDCIFGLSSFCFDLAIYDVFGALSVGACLSLPNQKSLRSPKDWLLRLQQDSVTIWNSVPVLMELALETVGDELLSSWAPALRLVLLSGDWIPTELAPAIKASNPDCRIISLGGATEASIWSILHEINPEDSRRSKIPYGRSMPGQWVEVCDKRLAPCPVNVTGEIVIGGAGVAKGYCNNPEQNRLQFTTHPATLEKVYRTGDYGRLMPNGEIEFLGRRDGQVKIAGNRIELEEIENAAHSVRGLKRFHVAALDDPGSKRLVAFFSGSCTRDDILSVLRGTLPPASIPETVVQVPSFPITDNGKIDYSKLESMGNLPNSSDPGTPPETQGADMIKLMEMISDYFPDNVYAPDDNLLRRGISSVSIIRFLNAIEVQFGKRVTFAELHERPYVHAIAELLKRNRSPISTTPESTMIAAAHQSKESWQNPVPVGGTQIAESRSSRARSGFFPNHISPYTDDIETRRSVREFSTDPIPLENLAAMFSCLREIERSGEPAYFYPSAGGYYTVDVFLAVKACRIEGLNAGLYQYDPQLNDLHVSTPNIEIHSDANIGTRNLELADASAFSIYLVTKPALTVPFYGEAAEHLAYLNAGYMGSLLDRAARENGLGLCAAHGIDFDAIRYLFMDGMAYELVHALYGGHPANLPDIALADRRRIVL